MAQIRVRVLDNNTLELLDDGKAGDTIDLRSLQEIDITPIVKKIEEGRDQVYQNKLQQVLNEAKAKYEEDVRNLNTIQASKLSEKELAVKDRYIEEINHLKSLIQSNEASSNENIAKIKNDNEILINNLRNEINNKSNELSNINNQKNNEKKLELEALESRLNSKYNSEITELKTKLENKDVESQNKLNSAVLAKEIELREELGKKYDLKAEELEQVKKELAEIRNQKAATNVKNIGEELETYCDNAVVEIMQNGWNNCTWTKDNKVVKNDGDVKGSKADYIFKVYADESKEENQIIASVCLDMKDENPNSVNKHKNKDYFKALDDNRKKKNCRYAVLVSNLEMEHGDLLPIYRANEYEDMYVVRPGYLITFLNMIISLSTRYKDLVLNRVHEELEVKDRAELLEEFNALKNTYLDKPLDAMSKQITAIFDQSELITKANNKIQDSCQKIQTSYINSIINKLENFEMKIKRKYNNYEKNK